MLGELQERLGWQMVGTQCGGWRSDGERLRILLFGTPVDEVAGVERDTKEIGGNETELRGANANDANYSAIEGGNDPTLPELLANKYSGENR